MALKVCREFDDVTLAGKSFLVNATAMGNSQSPTVDSAFCVNVHCSREYVCICDIFTEILSNLYQANHILDRCGTSKLCPHIGVEYIIFSHAGVESEAGIEIALNFKTLEKFMKLFLKNEKKAMKSFVFSSRANRTSDGSGLKVDGNC